MEIDRQKLSFLTPRLLDEIAKQSIVKEFPEGTEILREEQYIKVLPVVLSGIVKVYSRFEDKELLLYYIEPSQSCIMTFYAALKNTPSKVSAVTEEHSELLLIPVRHLPGWLREYPEFNELFYNLYNLRYSEMLDTISHLLLDKMDKRLFDHLKKKWVLTGHKPIAMSHSRIAGELGTAREVVTRILKKLETEGKVVQTRKGISIVGKW